MHLNNFSLNTLSPFGCEKNGKTEYLAIIDVKKVGKNFF